MRRRVGAPVRRVEGIRYSLRRDEDRIPDL
jgi:hypothetical protein